MGGDIWFLADTHFGHENVLEYGNRPFKSVEEMDEYLITEWNKKVKRTDKIYFLGDFAFTGKARIEELVGRLNGVKILVKGNHDARSSDFWAAVGFKEVTSNPILLLEYGLVLSHNPIEEYLGGIFNVHGHIHNHIEEYEGKRPGRFKCVSVENVGYAPINIKDVIKAREKGKGLVK